MRDLVLLHDRRPMMTSITPGPIRARILEWPEDDADLFTVWSVPIDESMAQPHDYLAPIPAFVRHACGAKAIAAWNRRSDATITALREEVARYDLQLNVAATLAKQNMDALDRNDTIPDDVHALISQRIIRILSSPSEELPGIMAEMIMADRAARALINEAKETTDGR